MSVFAVAKQGCCPAHRFTVAAIQRERVLKAPAEIEWLTNNDSGYRADKTRSVTRHIVTITAGRVTRSGSPLSQRNSKPSEHQALVALHSRDLAVTSSLRAWQPCSAL
jgi:hypothetical protein